MPPNRVLLWRCASFSYGNGATRCEKNSTMSPRVPEVAGHRRALLGRRVHHLVHATAVARESAGGVGKVESRERRRGDGEQIHRDRVRFAPARLGPASVAIRGDGDLVDERPVGHDVHADGRAHGPRDGRLVARMIDRRNPVPRAVGPVVAESHPPAGAVGADDQAVGDRAAVLDAHVQRIVARAAEEYAHLPVLLRECGRATVEQHAVDPEIEQIQHERVGCGACARR